MAEHAYSAAQALEAILRRVGNADIDLSGEMQSAIDAGKDEVVREPQDGRRKRHSYRRAVPLTTEESLKVVLDVFRAHFVEQPMFANAAAEDFRQAGVGLVSALESERLLRPAETRDSGEEKALAIETLTPVQSETRILGLDQEYIAVEGVPVTLLDEMVARLSTVEVLTSFEGGLDDGDTH